jgi:hypothetical protein
VVWDTVWFIVLFCLECKQEFATKEFIFWGGHEKARAPGEGGLFSAE